MMRIKLPDGREIESRASETAYGKTVILLGVVEVGPGGCDGFELLDADVDELDALLRASGAGLWSVQNTATGQELGVYQAENRSGAILACIGDGQGGVPDLFADPVDKD